MIEKWDSMNKSKNKCEQIWWSKSEIQWINRKISTDHCKWIIRYFAEIFVVLQHTDQIWTKNKLIVVIRV